MKPSPDQLDAIIYFLLYITALGLIATIAAGIDSIVKFFIRRISLSRKHLE